MSNPVVLKIEKAIALLIAAFSAGVLIFLIVCSVPSFGKISDFPEYFGPARMVVEGNGAKAYLLPEVGAKEQSLFPALGDRTVALFIPPPGLALLSSLGVIPHQVAPGIWKAFLILCLVSALVICTKLYKLKYKEICYLCAAVFLSQAAFESLRIDQVAPILLAAYAGALYFLSCGRDKSAAACFAVMILKPQQMLPFIFFLAGLGRWKVVLWCAAFLLGLTLLSLIQIGLPGYQNYLALIQSPVSLLHMQPELTATLRGQLLRLHTLPALATVPNSAITLVTLIAYLCTLVACFVFGRKARHLEAPIDFGVLSCMPLIVVTSFHCHSYDLLLLIPTLLILFSDRVVTTSPFTKLAIMAAGAIFMVPFAIYIHYDYLLKGGIINPWFVALSIFACFILSLVARRLSSRGSVPKPGSLTPADSESKSNG